MIEERMARIEGIAEQMNARLNHLETEMQALNGGLDALADRLDSSIRDLRGEMGGLRGEIGGLRGEAGELSNQMNTQFRWTLAFIMGMWVTVIVAVLFR